MAKTITLHLKKDLIMEAVKADTYDTGRITKSGDPVKNVPVGMSQQAGGESHQERQLLRYLKASVAKFESQMAEFLDASTGSISNTLSDSQSDFNIIMIVNDRYNNGMAEPMSSLCEDYLVNMMLFSWWNSRNQQFSEQFKINALDSIQHTRLCLTKTAPEASAANYTDVTGTVTQH